MRYRVWSSIALAAARRQQNAAAATAAARHEPPLAAAAALFSLHSQQQRPWRHIDSSYSSRHYSAAASPASASFKPAAAAASDAGNQNQSPSRRPHHQGDDVLNSIQTCMSLLDLEDLLDSRLRALTYVHLGAAAMRVAKLARAGSGSNNHAPDARAARQLTRVMQHLEGLYVRTMPMLPARPIAHLVYAAGRTGHALSERTVIAAAQHLTRGDGARLAAAAGADLAQLSWGLARCRLWLPELQAALDAAVVAKAAHLDASAVSTLLTAAQLSRNTDAALLDALARRLLALAPAAPPMALAQAAHALVKLAHPSDAVLQGVAVVLAPQLRALSPATLLLVLGSYRLAEHPSAPGLAAEAAPILAAAAPKLEPALIVRAAREYARIERAAAAAAGAAGAQFVIRADGGSSDSSDRSSSETKYKASHEELWAALNAAAVAALPRFERQELQALARALGPRAAPEIVSAVSAAA